MATPSLQTRQRTDYPTSDGKPMAETDTHRNLMVDMIQRLSHRYEDDADVYVSGNLLLFYEEGNKRKHVSPDVFVVFGVKKMDRLNYLLWQEGRSPDFITEITSSSTRNEDKKKKLVLYRDVIKVKEYFQFDPFGDYLNPRLQGFRLLDGDYVPIVPIDGRLPSEVLGLHLEARGAKLLLYDPATGQYVPTPEERAEQEKLKAEQEKLKAEQEKLKAEQEKRKAEQEKQEADQKADQERKRADEEKERADRAEREKAELLAEIERLRRQKRNGA